MRSFRLALALVGFQAVASAQVEHGGRPPSERLSVGKNVPTVSLAPVRSDLLLAEDAALAAASGGKGPLRFAEVLPVDLDLAHSGRWESLPGGGALWRLRLSSRGAKSLALVFSRFQLPPGAELYVYDDSRTHLRGAYTEHENRLDGEFALRPTRGDALTLEYFEPAAVRGRGELALALVAHDYRDVVSLLEPSDRTGGGTSGRCEIDVSCPLGATWASQIDSAVHVCVVASGLLCSGSLLNNTAQDGTVLLLSAAHCGNLATAVYTFNFENPACRTGPAPTTDVLTGATVLVKDDALDVQLVRLSAPQGPLNFPATLAGWDRTDVIPASSVIIHHPAGDVKKISLDDDAPRIFENFWRILDWERGVTEGGSSGAPMFDPAGRFIGNLDSGSSSCQVPANDDFATRLAAVWPVLEPYLDPLGTGQLTLDALDLAQAPVRPFDVTGVFPPEVDTLTPDTARALRVLGSGFGDASEVWIDGQALDPLAYVRGGHSFFNLDLPPLDAGTHMLEVREAGQMKSASLRVVPPLTPKLQVGDGTLGAPVLSAVGVELFHADQPGHLHYCYWSLSNVPSIHPLLTLGIGNGFSDLQGCLIQPIPAQGWLRAHHAVPPGFQPFGTPVYCQSACVSHGRPLAASNVQMSEFLF